MVNLIAPRPKEALQAIESWIDLKRELARFRTSQASKRRCGHVLTLLGLPYEKEQQFTRTESGLNSQWAHFTFEADPKFIESVRGAPLFGSQAKGTYHIVCFWEGNRPDQISKTGPISRLAQHSHAPVVVLYLAPLTDTDRQEVKLDCWKEDISVAVVDELLLEFLARTDAERTLAGGNRFQAFLAATLPYASANPYNPETAGWGARVPPEMFYGRQELAGEIMRMRGGTSIIFGGRQLGKTALLRHVEETFSRPGEGHFASLIDLKDEGYVPVPNPENAKDPADIFGIIHNMFKSARILKDGTPDGSSDGARQDILNAFKADPNLQILAMFDESDTFLKLDSENGSAAVESMRVLMDGTDNRFKVVFAGLHNVQRFAHGSNNPFPNLGFNPNRPRRGGIGPLPDQEARKLVEEPFNLLGFRFQSLTVDKILSYTNRHPSLVQFFCHELMKTWRERNPGQHPPYDIGIEEVDRVYRLPSIQDGIKRRFEETFKLDSRYHVISLTMILYQDNPTQKWSLEQIREHCQYCWPLTFGPQNLEAVELQSLLNELIGLGILAEDGDSFRMRSPLIAQMFGSKGDIERNLEELEANEPIETSNHNGSES